MCHPDAYNNEIPPHSLFKLSIIRSCFSFTCTSDVQQTRIIAIQPCVGLNLGS